MLTSVGEDGRLYSRPMYTHEADRDRCGRKTGT